jgi:hypothetical protein
VLQKVTVGRWALDSYDALAPAGIMAELREHAQALRGARILHVNATAYGGGVSELLRSSIPLLRDLGLTVDWKVIGGNPDFFHATKALHNALQGAPRPLSETEQTAYRQCNEENAGTLDGTMTSRSQRVRGNVGQGMTEPTRVQASQEVAAIHRGPQQPLSPRRDRCRAAAGRRLRLCATAAVAVGNSGAAGA